MRRQNVVIRLWEVWGYHYPSGHVWLIKGGITDYVEAVTESLVAYGRQGDGDMDVDVKVLVRDVIVAC